MRKLNQQIQMLVEESDTRRKLRQISGGPGPEEAVGLPRRGRGPVHVLCWCPPSPRLHRHAQRSRRSVARRTSAQQEARLADRQRVERARRKTFLPQQVLKKLLLIKKSNNKKSEAADSDSSSDNSNSSSDSKSSDSDSNSDNENEISE